MKTLWLLLPSLLATLALSGCGTLLLGASTQFDLALEPTAARAAPGGEARVGVTISKLVPVDVVPLPVTVTLEDAPAGVRADDLVFGPGENRKTLVVRVDASVALGGPYTLRVVASNGVVTKERPFELTVTAGSP